MEDHLDNLHHQEDLHLDGDQRETWLLNFVSLHVPALPAHDRTNSKAMQHYTKYHLGRW